MIRDRISSVVYISSAFSIFSSSRARTCKYRIKLGGNKLQFNRVSYVVLNVRFLVQQQLLKILVNSDVVRGQNVRIVRCDLSTIASVISTRPCQRAFQSIFIRNPVFSGLVCGFVCFAPNVYPVGQSKNKSYINLLNDVL